MILHMLRVDRLCGPDMKALVVQLGEIVKDLSDGKEKGLHYEVTKDYNPSVSSYQPTGSSRGEVGP